MQKATAGEFPPDPPRIRKFRVNNWDEANKPRPGHFLVFWSQRRRSFSGSAYRVLAVRQTRPGSQAIAVIDVVKVPAVPEGATRHGWQWAPRKKKARRLDSLSPLH